MQLQTVSLAELGQTLAVDVDYPLVNIDQGSLLLLNQRPQRYPWEQHSVAERIVALQGSLVIETEDEQISTANVGEMIVVPAGLRHRYAETTDGVALVLFGGTEAAGSE